MDTLDQLEKLPVNPKNYKPLTETRLNSVTIHANPLAGWFKLHEKKLTLVREIFIY